MEPDGNAVEPRRRSRRKHMAQGGGRREGGYREGSRRKAGMTVIPEYRTEEPRQDAPMPGSTFTPQIKGHEDLYTSC